MESSPDVAAARRLSPDRRGAEAHRSPAPGGHPAPRARAGAREAAGRGGAARPPARPLGGPPRGMGSDRRRTEMASKKHRPEEAVAKLRQVDVLVSQGQTVAEAIRAIGVTEVTHYRWRREFGGLKSDQVKRLKELEAENTRLRKAVADLTLDKQILAEAARGNF